LDGDVMATDLPIPVGASPRDLVYQAVYTGRAEMGHWLASHHDAELRRQQNEGRQSVGLPLLPSAAPDLRMPQDEEAASLLARAEAEEAVPPEVAAAYQELIAARPLAEVDGGATEADAARLRTAYGVVRAWLDTQG
jgi:hypothetical protein